MADANKPTFAFGTPATTAPSAGGLFGATSTPDKDQQQPKTLFGGAATTGKSLFGGNNTGTTTGGLFGAPTTNTASTSAGNLTVASTAPTGGFRFNTGTASTAPATSTSLFGNTSTANAAPSSNTSLFGGAKATTTSAPSLFGSGGTTTSTAAPSLFGAKTATSGPGLFGGAATTTSTATPSLFGAKTASPGPGLFGAPAITTTPSLFGANIATPTTMPDANSIFNTGRMPSPTPGGLFQNLGKASEANTPQAKPLSSNSSTPAGNPGSGGTGLFGAVAAQPSVVPTGPSGATSTENKLPSFGTLPGGKSLFGEVKPAENTGNAAAAVQSNSSVALNAQATTTATVPPTTGLFANLSKPDGQASAAPASTTSGLFAGLGQKKPDTPASSATPSAGLFSAQTPATTAASTTSNLFGGAQPAAPTASSSAAPSGGLFGAASSSAQPTTSTPASGPASSTSLFGAAPATQGSATAAPAAGASLFGASTGNAPATSTLQQPSSRLASKSLDEIITTWSTSLATHQKTFASVSERVAKWDRQLVENSSAIGNLYSRVFQAERDTAEVERQLSTVEASQRELEARLEKYESEVDSMLEAAGLGDEGAPSGVDAERERTYHAAQEAQIRLTDMSHDLTSMIEEINLASGKLSSTKKADSGEDPLAQIVRVLNSHLSQLQAIDKSASALTLKVDQAKKDAGIAASRNGLTGGREWVEGFGWSYLGRR